MSDLYNITSERLWEKLEFYRKEFDLNSVNIKQPFPADQILPHSLFLQLVNEVEKEYNYEMSEFQGSWAVVQFIYGGLPMMEKYNKENGTNLQPRQ